MSLKVNVRIFLLLIFIFPNVWSCRSGIKDLLNDQKFGPVPTSTSSGGVPGVIVTQSGSSTTATEGGAGDNYTVVLTTQPSANVTITVTPGSQTTVTPSTLIFTAGTCPGAGNWCTAQTVTVGAVDNGLADGNHTGTITHSATSTDSSYNGISIASVTVNITDNDSAGVSIVESGGSTTATEGGAGDSYTVVLTFQPTSDVTITVNPDAQVTRAPATLTFAATCPAANCWNIAQTVTVGAVDDAVSEGTHTGTITHTATSGDASYNGIGIGAVMVSITDNDAAKVTNVTSSLADGTYAGNSMTTIPIQMTFTAPVFVTGIPRLRVATGTPPFTLAAFTSGSGTNVLTFSFTTTASMSSPDLDYESNAAVQLLGGTINDSAGFPAILTLPNPGAAGSLGANKAIVIN